MSTLVNKYQFESTKQRDEKMDEFYPFRRIYNDCIPGEYVLPNGNHLVVFMEEVSEYRLDGDEVDMVISDEQLEYELHLLADLLNKYKGLVNVFSQAGDEYIETVADYSPELHKCVNIHLERSR